MEWHVVSLIARFRRACHLHLSLITDTHSPISTAIGQLHAMVELLPVGIPPHARFEPIEKSTCLNPFNVITRYNHAKVTLHSSSIRVSFQLYDVRAGIYFVPPMFQLI